MPAWFVKILIALVPVLFGTVVALQERRIASLEEARSELTKAILEMDRTAIRHEAKLDVLREMMRRLEEDGRTRKGG